MKPFFLYAILPLTVALLINVAFVIFKPGHPKRIFKAWVCMVQFYFIVIYGYAYVGVTNYLLRSGWLTVVGIIMLAFALSFESLADWKD